jgi:hypothetical protein
MVAWGGSRLAGGLDGCYYAKLFHLHLHLSHIFRLHLHLSHIFHLNIDRHFCHFCH